MLILVCAGMILEKALGHVKFTILYLIAGVGGNVLSCAQMLYTKDYAVSAGASGAIFGIVGALLWIVILHRGRYESPIRSPVPFLPCGIVGFDFCGFGIVLANLLGRQIYAVFVKNCELLLGI